jgi:hypothetical protein
MIVFYPAQEVSIIDPDGWNRSDYHFSWNIELITEKEFKERMFHSTCFINIK